MYYQIKNKVAYIYQWNDDIAAIKQGVDPVTQLAFTSDNKAKEWAERYVDSFVNPVPVAHPAIPDDLIGMPVEADVVEES